MTSKWKARERKQHKKKTGMRISGRSILIIPDILKKRADKIKKKSK